MIDDVAAVPVGKDVLENALVNQIVRVEEHHIGFVTDERLAEPRTDEAPLARLVAAAPPLVSGLGERHWKHVDVFPADEVQLRLVVTGDSHDGGFGDGRGSH